MRTTRERLNKFISLYMDRPPGMNNKQFMDAFQLSNDQFYRSQKKLLALKRMDPETMKIIDPSEINSTEYMKLESPKKRRKKRNGKRANDKDKTQLITKAEEVLLNPVDLKVKGESKQINRDQDMIKLSYSELAKIIISIIK